MFYVDLVDIALFCVAKKTKTYFFSYTLYLFWIRWVPSEKIMQLCQERRVEVKAGGGYF